MTLTRRGKVVVLLTAAGSVILVVAVGIFMYLRSVDVLGESSPGKTVEVVIPKGTSVLEVGDILVEKGVISSTTGWQIAVKLEGTPVIQAGEYQLYQGLTPRDALAALTESGPQTDYTTVTFPEGSWITDFGRILERDTHISSSAFTRVATSGRIRSMLMPDDVDTLEGLLFPSTYQIVEKDTAETVAKRLLSEFERRIEKLDFSEVEEMGFTRYEAVVVASMIEAEAKVEAERPKVAAVIYNRLADGMTLGIDATVEYALGRHIPSLTTSDLAVDSPYNTRVVAGLPPTPIGAPGLSALEAALSPASGNWLYYVLADCDGHHAFSETYQDFLRNKSAYQSLSC